MAWYSQKKKEDDRLRSRILARTERLVGETSRQHLNRMMVIYQKEKKKLYEGSAYFP